MSQELIDGLLAAFPMPAVLIDQTERLIAANVEGATVLGKSFAEKAKSAGIESVVFDRSGRRYHGCVKSFADAAREGGLKF